MRIGVPSDGRNATVIECNEFSLPQKLKKSLNQPFLVPAIANYPGKCRPQSWKAPG